MIIDCADDIRILDINTENNLIIFKHEEKRYHLFIKNDDKYLRRYNVFISLCDDNNEIIKCYNYICDSEKDIFDIIQIRDGKIDNEYFVNKLVEYKFFKFRNEKVDKLEISNIDIDSKFITFRYEEEKYYLKNTDIKSNDEKTVVDLLNDKLEVIFSYYTDKEFIKDFIKIDNDGIDKEYFMNKLIEYKMTEFI